MFNRKLEPLSIANEFQAALGNIRAQLDCEAFKWVDVEALERRHNIGRGTLIVLDAIPELPLTKDPATQRDRIRWLSILETADLDPRCIKPNSLLVPHSGYSGDILWNNLAEWNKKAGVEFYEGVVAKKADSLYPMQLRSPDIEFPFWQKHRWKF